MLRSHLRQQLSRALDQLTGSRHSRAATRIVETVRVSVEGRTGPDRVLTAIEVAVAEIRADPADQLFLDSARGGGWSWLTASPAVADFARELTGWRATTRPRRDGSCALCCRCCSGRTPIRLPNT